MTQKKVRILLAEDDSAETVDILAALFPNSTGGLDLTVVSTMATLIPTVKVVDPELILLDLELSLSNPLDAVHLVHRSAPGIPPVAASDSWLLGRFTVKESKFRPRPIPLSGTTRAVD